jgi:hypothetical protein
MAFMLYILVPVLVMSSCVSIVLDAPDEVEIIGNCLALLLLLQVKDIAQKVLSPHMECFTLEVPKRASAEIQRIKWRFVVVYSFPFWLPLIVGFVNMMTLLLSRNAHPGKHGRIFHATKLFTMEVFRWLSIVQGGMLFSLTFIAMFLILVQVHWSESGPIRFQACKCCRFFFKAHKCCGRRKDPSDEEEERPLLDEHREHIP